MNNTRKKALCATVVTDIVFAAFSAMWLVINVWIGIVVSTAFVFWMYDSTMALKEEE